MISSLTPVIRSDSGTRGSNVSNLMMHEFDRKLRGHLGILLGGQLALGRAPGVGGLGFPPDAVVWPTD